MFAGIGGFRSGLSHYGDFFVPVGYCEIDPYAKRAYEAIYEPKGEIYFEDAREIAPESLPDIDLICGVISEFGEPNSVRVFQSLESEGALKMPEERCSLKSLELPALKDLTFCSLKTFPDSFRMTGAGRLRPSSVRWMNWGIMSHGRCLTAQISEFPNSEKECCLSDILEKNPEAKYYLSRNQTQKLLSKGLAGVRVIRFTPETD